MTRLGIPPKCVISGSSAPNLIGSGDSRVAVRSSTATWHRVSRGCRPRHEPGPRVVQLPAPNRCRPDLRDGVAAGRRTRGRRRRCSRLPGICVQATTAGGCRWPTLARGPLRLPYRLVGDMRAFALHDRLVARRLRALPDRCGRGHRVAAGLARDTSDRRVTRNPDRPRAAEYAHKVRLRGRKAGVRKAWRGASPRSRACVQSRRAR